MRGGLSSLAGIVYVLLQVIHGKQHFMTTHGKVRSQLTVD